MAEKRRLQGEIDRTLKKANEGRMSFKETLDKFESSTNHAQKEKHEADLKKEIKKLQRFRDNIKTWLASPEVKDKTQLIEMRKLIESDMERFKVIEKETKTKAYSKEGLYIETKKDPMQKEKEDHLEWLKLQISKLSKNIEVCDFDIVKLNPVKKKRNAEKDKLNELTQKLGMFKNHLSKQETLMRLLDNDKIELDKVKDFRYTFEEFINNPELELYKSDQGLFIYDELNLDELSADISIAADLDTSGKLEIPDSLGTSFSIIPPYFVEKKDSITITTGSSVDKLEIPDILLASSSVVIDELSIKCANITEKPKEKPPAKLVSKPKPPNIDSTNGKIAKNPTNININTHVNITASQPIAITSTPIKNCTTVPLLDGSDYLSIHNISDSSIKESPIESSMFLSSITTATSSNSSTTTTSANLVSCQPVNTAHTPILETVSHIDSSPLPKESYFTDVIKCSVSVAETSAVVVSTANYMTAFSANIVPNEPVVNKCNKPKFEPIPTVNPQQQQMLLSDIPTCQQSYFEMQSHFLQPLLQQQQQLQQNELSISHQYSMAAAAAAAASAQRSSLPSMLDQMVSITSSVPPPMLPGNSSGGGGVGGVGGSLLMASKDNTIDMILEPGDAMSPFRNHSFQSNDYYNSQVAAMDHGRSKQPLSSDSEKARLIIYKNETAIPDYFPRDPLPGNDTEDYYMRLDSDTLFFIFYYFEGTKAQYLAAKALKRMSWRFHTGHMCWFQRHEEPKQITDNSESGTYIFYDFESMSRQKKENFTFSYNYLEDKDF